MVIDEIITKVLHSISMFSSSYISHVLLSPDPLTHSPTLWFLTMNELQFLQYFSIPNNEEIRQLDTYNNDVKLNAFSRSPTPPLTRSKRSSTPVPSSSLSPAIPKIDYDSMNEETAKSILDAMSNDELMISLSSLHPGQNIPHFSSISYIFLLDIYI